jgi:hypothetical protein
MVCHIPAVSHMKQSAPLSLVHGQVLSKCTRILPASIIMQTVAFIGMCLANKATSASAQHLLEWHAPIVHTLSLP